MKTSLKLLTLAGLLCAGLLTLNAADKKHIGGPKGGRLLEKTEPKAEFSGKDHSATIVLRRRTEAGRATAQTVTVIADAKAGRRWSLKRRAACS
jgi:hypothetical protein